MSQWHPANATFTCRFAKAAPTGCVHAKQLKTRLATVDARNQGCMTSYLWGCIFIIHGGLLVIPRAHLPVMSPQVSPLGGCREIKDKSEKL